MRLADALDYEHGGRRLIELAASARPYHHIAAGRIARALAQPESGPGAFPDQLPLELGERCSARRASPGGTPASRSRPNSWPTSRRSDGSTSTSPENTAGQVPTDGQRETLSVGCRPLPQTTRPGRNRLTAPSHCLLSYYPRAAVWICVKFIAESGSFFRAARYSSRSTVSSGVLDETTSRSAASVSPSRLNALL